MSDLEFLDAENHRHLRVDDGNAKGRHFVQLVGEEIPAAALEYPVLFAKNPETGAFYAGAVFGLEAGTNLFAPDGELKGYRPADLVRQGFFLNEGRIAIAPGDPVFVPDGKPIFDDHGEATVTLREVQNAMHVLQQGLGETDRMIMRFVENRLIEPIDITLGFDDGSRLQLEGLYSISLDALHAIPEEVALELFRKGDLQIAYLQAASVRHIRRMAQIRNERLFAEA